MKVSIDDHVLTQAAEEIRELRRHRNFLQAQVDVVNIFGLALGGKAPERGMAEDIAWRLDQAAKGDKTQ